MSNSSRLYTKKVGRGEKIGLQCMSIYFPPVGMASEEYAAVGLPVIYEVILPFFQLSFKVVMIDDRQLYLFFSMNAACGRVAVHFSLLLAALQYVRPYVLLVWWITSLLHMVRHSRSDALGGRQLKISHQRTIADRGPSLMSTVAYLHRRNGAGFCTLVVCRAVK